MVKTLSLSTNLSSKCSKKLLDNAKEYATSALKTVSKRATQKTVDATGNSTGSQIADRITKFSKTSPQNNLETVTNEHDKEVPKERYITSEEREKIIDDLRSM